ncbi:MAG TPA: hypothetical protein VFY48_06090 [Solirubrobacterales bacterium]|nr:hypothetical protein [Solirubrobacterales bacterium]
MSRFRLFALLAALMTLATVFAACGGGDSDDPQQVLDNATLEGVESGNLDISLTVKGEGDEGGDIDVAISGPFQSKETEDLPELAMTASATGVAEGKDIDFEGGLTLLSDRAFVNYEGTDYEVDPTTFGLVKQSFEQAQDQGSEGNAADVTACQEAAEGMEVGDFAENLTSEDGVDVDGTSTTKVSGELNTEGALDAIIELSEDPACSAQLDAAGPVPVEELEEARDEISGAVKKAQVDVYVGDDDIIRKAVAEMTIEPQDSKDEKVEVDFELTLSGVNEPQQISGPAKSQPIQGLFQKLGINPIELLETASSGEGLGELLEDLTESLPEAGGASSGGSGGSDGGSSGGGGGSRQAYLECLKDAQTSADLQQCASMIQ